MSSLDKLPNSFQAEGTNERLDLSLPRCASCCSTNCPCSTWSGSLIARFAKESVAPNQLSSACCIPARTGKFSVGVGRKHPLTMRKASLRMLSMGRICVLQHQKWCAVLSGGVDQKKSRDAQCLGTCTLSKSRKSPQQCNSGGQFLAQSLKVVTESERPIQLYPEIRWNSPRHVKQREKNMLHNA